MLSTTRYKCRRCNLNRLKCLVENYELLTIEHSLDLLDTIKSNRMLFHCLPIIINRLCTHSVHRSVCMDFFFFQVEKSIYFGRQFEHE